LGFRVQGLGFVFKVWVLGFGVRALVFGVRVSGFGFQASGFGFGVLSIPGEAVGARAIRGLDGRIVSHPAHCTLHPAP